MAITKCKECKKEVSTGAKSCPHCGASYPGAGIKELIVGVGFVAVVGLIGYNYFSSDSEGQAPGQAAASQAGATDSPAPPPTSSPKAVEFSRDEVGIARDFCLNASKVYSSIDSSFQKLQNGISDATKSRNTQKVVNTVHDFSVRASELQEDASKLLPPNIESDKANSAMKDMADAVKGTSIKNSEAADNLIALFSSQISPERAQENGKSIGDAKDYLTIKYARAALNLADALGYAAEDTDDKTMCLTQSAISKPQKNAG